MATKTVKDEKTADVPGGGFFYSVRKFYERGASMSDFVDGPNSAGPHYTFSA